MHILHHAIEKPHVLHSKSKTHHWCGTIAKWTLGWQSCVKNNS